VRVNNADPVPIAPEKSPTVPERPSAKPGAGPVYAALATGAPATVRTRVLESIARTYGVGPTELRAVFDPRDELVLDMQEAARTIIVRPSTTGSSARPMVEVRVVEGERVISSAMICADIELFRPVVVAGADITRHQEIRSGMVREEYRWMSPGTAPLVSALSEVEGQRAVKRLRMGDLVTISDIEGVTVVKRGELVVVECVRNGISLQAKARALADGCIGDRVECRVGDSKKTFIGTVDAVGRVVVVLGE